MASNNDPSEQGARMSDSCEPAGAHMVAHEGAMCDDCGCDHGAYTVEQRGVRYLLCESCYDYACTAADSDSEVEEQYDDFEAEQADDQWEDDGPEIVGSNSWWAGGIQDARDNGAYGLLVGDGRW